MKLTTDDARALLDELRLLQPPERGEGDIDARQYAEMFTPKLTSTGAHGQLMRLVADGVLTTNMVRDPDHRRPVRVWRRVDKAA